MVYVGIDLGGTNIAVGLVDEAGKILHKDSVPTLLERGPEPVIKDMANLSLKVVKDAGYTVDDVKAIGVGVPGLADPKTGVVIFCTNLRWHMVPLREISRRSSISPSLSTTMRPLRALRNPLRAFPPGLQTPCS